jgi:NitT/TauT family transport system ATP-binding protein
VLSRPDETLLHLRGIGKTFPGGITALAGVDLDIRRGEFLTLLGPSGCGKSTILRLIAGLVAPSEGEIAWTNGAQPEIGFVFQDPTLMPWANVFNNVYLPLRLAGVRRAEAAARVSEKLARVGLAGFEKAYPRELSGGMRMRASLARALVADAPLLLLDEPFAALDEITRFALNDDLLALQRELRTTIVFVTHSVFESVYLSQRIAVMSSRPGRIVDELAINGPEPRDPDFRTSAGFADQARDVSAALRDAMAADITQ